MNKTFHVSDKYQEALSVCSNYIAGSWTIQGPHLPMSSINPVQKMAE